MTSTSFAFPLPSIPEPPAPAPRAAGDDRTRVRADERDQEDAFERALKQEMERKALANAAPQANGLLPFLVPVPATQQAAVEGVTAASSATSVASPYTARAFTPASYAADTASQGAVAPAERVERPEDGPTAPIRIVVEAGLPPVQPGEDDDAQKVSLVDFPQVVVGQVRNMVRDNKPLTQLDFQITPPNVGPVNLQVSYTQGVVGVQLTALTLQAKQALESQVGTIQQILTAHNLTPGQVRVVTAVGGRGGANGAGMKGDQAGFGFFTGGRRRSPGSEDGSVRNA